MPNKRIITESLVEQNAVFTASTSVTIKPWGVTIFPSTASKVYTMDLPIIGVTKRFVQIGTSTEHKVTLGGTSVGTFDGGTTGTGVALVFNALGDSIEIVGYNASTYQIISNNSVLISTV